MVLVLLLGGLETIGLAQTRLARGRTGPNASHFSHAISLLDTAKAQHSLGFPITGGVQDIDSDVSILSSS